MKKIGEEPRKEKNISNSAQNWNIDTKHPLTLIELFMKYLNFSWSEVHELQQLLMHNCSWTTATVHWTIVVKLQIAVCAQLLMNDSNY